MELFEKILKRDNSLHWARQMHEIVKYPPEGYNADGIFTMDDWTSVHDIGKSFGGKVLSREDYLLTENNYIECAITIARRSHCRFLTVAYMEDYGWKPGKGRHIKYHSRIAVENLRCILEAMLREQCYCVLVNLSRKVQIEVGYDYYMHVLTPLERHELQEIVSSCHLFLDPRASRHEQKTLYPCDLN